MKNVPIKVGNVSAFPTSQAGMVYSSLGTRSVIVSKDGIRKCLTATDYKQPQQLLEVTKPENSIDKEYCVRRLTPTECERLQGFPDNWTKLGIDDKGNGVQISDTQRYKACGNAVTVHVIEAIISKLLKSM